MRTSTTAFVATFVFAGSLFALTGGCSDDETDKPTHTTTFTTTTTTTTNAGGAGGAMGGSGGMVVGGSGGVATGGSGGEPMGGSGGEATGGSGGEATGGSGGQGTGGSGGGATADPYCPTTPVISEFLPNPPSNDDTLEFIEIAVANGAALDSIGLLVVEADTGANEGQVTLVVDLDNVQSGSNCIILVTEGADPYGAGAFTEHNVPGTGLTIQNDSQTLLLVDYSGGSLPALNADLDANDDGTLDAPLSFTILDAVAAKDDGASDPTYSALHVYTEADDGFTLAGYTLSQSLGPVAGLVFGTSPAFEYATNVAYVDPDTAAQYDLSPGEPNP